MSRTTTDCSNAKNRKFINLKMSSALSSLKKNRRAPLIPGGHKQSERQIYTERPYADEAALLTEFFPQAQTGPEDKDSLTSLRSKVMQKRTPKEGCPPSDFELMSSMVQKLGQLERKVKAQALDINSKARQIAVLEEKLKLLQVVNKTEGEKCEEEGLAEKCRRLQNQVWEMERFLNDYGMSWVGDGEDHGLTDEAQLADSGHPLWKPGASVVRRFSMNFDLILQNIIDLNILAGEGQSYVTSVPGGAKLTQQNPVPLWLYKNGIVMFNGPFRSYHDPSTQRCMQDLMDGYYPSELQEKFPEGVVFQVYDRREEEFRVGRAPGFPGKGRTVGGSEQKLLDHREEDRRTQSQSLLSGRKLSMEQFMNKLPESVVKGGKVINIRSSLKAHLQGLAGGAPSHSVSVIETPALQTLRQRLESNEAGCSGAEVTTLRVKSEDGEKTFILKMLFSDTIAHLRQHLNAHRGSSCPPYDIISAFPQRCHSDDTQTLLACGLTPNAALLLRPRPPQTSSTNPT